MRKLTHKTQNYTDQAGVLHTVMKAKRVQHRMQLQNSKTNAAVTGRAQITARRLGKSGAREEGERESRTDPSRCRS